MMLYLDDDSVRVHLVRLLVADGQDVQLPTDVGLTGADDPVHFRHAILEKRALLTHNYKDFNNLHELVIDAGGHHPGVVVVRRDNDPTRDLSPKGIVLAMRNLSRASIPIADRLHILNHWR
jgi:predicted nuclease of predicted toxin-antitoxin system